MIVETPEEWNGVRYTLKRKRPPEDRSGLYCVYLTEYFGSMDLPPLYIGVTYLENVTEHGYHGSSAVPAYLRELRNSPKQFKTTVIEVCDGPRRGHEIEAYYHKKFDVANSPWFWNIANATVGGWPETNANIAPEVLEKRSQKMRERFAKKASNKLHLRSIHLR